MSKKVWVLLAEGFEEVEALAPIDILRRGGLEVLTISITEKKEVKGAHGVTVTADYSRDKLGDTAALPDAVVLPGGLPGATNLHESKEVNTLLQHMRTDNRYIAAICASPAFVLAPEGLLKGHKATGYPMPEERLITEHGAELLSDGVVVDRKIITGRGPAYAMAFGFAILKELVGAAQAKEVADGFLFTLK